VLIRHACSNFAVSTFLRSPKLALPALCTRTRAAPTSWRTRPSDARSASSSVTSVGNAIVPGMSASNSASVSGERAIIATR